MTALYQILMVDRFTMLEFSILTQEKENTNYVLLNCLQFCFIMKVQRYHFLLK